VYLVGEEAALDVEEEDLGEGEVVDDGEERPEVVVDDGGRPPAGERTAVEQGQQQHEAPEAVDAVLYTLHNCYYYFLIKSSNK
jgi:hypothetical protein